MKPWAIKPSLIDTNAAFATATQFVAKAFVDLAKLSCAEVTINPALIRRMTTSIYTVEWKRGGHPLVQVTFDQSNAELWSLRVEDAEYILRKPLEVPSLAIPVSPTNIPAPTITPPNQ
jgi:hypothetical protein